MKNDSLKQALNRGFTLIELMIVIVILGVLMGTILPRLTGTQARARDLGRQADLRNIGNALQVYFDDNGVYPGVAGGPVCLDPNAEGANVAKDLAEYLDGGVPVPSASQITAFGGGSCVGAYLYAPLSKRGLPLNGYVLATDMEAYRNANVDTEVSGVIIDGTTSEEVAAEIEEVAAENGDATKTIFILVK